MSTSSESIVNNTEKNRFEVSHGSQISKLDYRMDDDNIALVHTEVPEDLTGQGIGSSLVVYALEYARENELTVLPSCPFVASYIDRHPEWNDIVGEL